MRWPGSGLAAGELTPERPSGNRTTLSKKAHGPRNANGTDHGAGHDQHAEEHDQGAPLPLPVARREERQRGQWPRRELHGRHDSQDDTGGERLSALRQHHGQQQEGHHRHVVAPGGQREGGGGKMAMTCRARILRRPSAGQSHSAMAATSNVARLKKIRASVSTTSCFFSLGMPNTVMIGRYGTNAVDGRLAAGVVDHLARRDWSPRDRGPSP